MYLTKRKGTYYVFYRKNGKRTCKSTKSSKKKEAYKYLIDFKYHLEQKELNPSLTLKEFYLMYMGKAELFLAQSSWKFTKNSFKTFIEQLGETTPIGEINHNMCETFLLNKFKVSKYSASLVYRHLKAAFNRGVQWELLKKNPFEKIKLPKIETRLPSYINENQLYMILEKENNPVLKANYAIAFYTGLRLNEGVNLKWGDINLIDKIIHIRNSEYHTTKSKKERIIPFGNKVEYYLNTLEKRNNHDFVFTLNGKRKLNYHKLSKWFKARVRECGLDEKIHYHSLRHSFASTLAQKEVSLYVIKELLGHSSISTTQIYAHLSKQSLVNAVKVFD